ncbi:MAG: hypothetical protein HYR73_05095, partial [Candidatus Eisenbacteria bacterium]|nr:hypothetical protein [Candidatus Eisenbacteria bacterium]
MALALAATVSLAAPVSLVRLARADWLQPDPSYRDAQLTLRAAQRDTLGQGGNAVRLDSLAVAHLRLAHFADARKLFLRVLAIQSGDAAASAGLAKLALFSDRPASTESLLAAPGALEADESAPRDRLAALTRLGHWADAATFADSLEIPGRAEMLRRIGEDSVYVVSGASEVKILFSRTLPAPLLRVKLNGQSVLMALDTGAGDLIVDDFVGRQCKVALLPGEGPVTWDGEQGVLRNAMVRRLE